MLVGIVGLVNSYSYDSIEECVSEGIIEGAHVGGIAGQIPQNGIAGITNCVNYAEIYATTSSGGILGYAGPNGINGCQIKNCKNYGKIEGVYSGGISGLLGAGTVRIEQCCNYSLVIGRNSSSGIFGYGDLPTVYIVNCGNDFNSTIQGDSYAGGLFGGLGNRGNIYIYNSYSLGTIKGNNYIGGICGNSHRTAGGPLGYTKIENSYFAGKIEGGRNIGGIIGSINSTSKLENISFSNCYYINTVSKGISNYEDENIISISEEDMKENDTLFNSLKSYTNSEYELSEWKKDANQYPIHSDQ